jgi:hypothetical protein
MLGGKESNPQKLRNTFGVAEEAEAEAEEGLQCQFSRPLLV